MQIAFIDHYDSFSKNVMAWLESCGLRVFHMYHDAIPESFVEHCSMPMIFSPGPGEPKDYPQSLNLLRRNLGRVPILGICLGHQMLGFLSGFEVVRSRTVWHGHPRNIHICHLEHFFAHAPSIIKVATYNSLCLRQGQNVVAQEWIVSAKNDVGEVEAIENWAHPLCPAIGLQFHPESFLSEDLGVLLSRWQDIVQKFIGF